VDSYGEDYYGLVEELVTAAQARYGRGVLIQWEDFGNSTAFHHLQRYQPRAVTFNDDIQVSGSAAVRPRRRG
jgi:malic enzyme